MFTELAGNILNILKRSKRYNWIITPNLAPKIDTTQSRFTLFLSRGSYRKKKKNVKFPTNPNQLFFLPVTTLLGITEKHSGTRGILWHLKNY